MYDALDDARSKFAPDELELLENLRVVTRWRREFDALSLAVEWTAWVERFDAERVFPASDMSVRTEHDFAGALFCRDRAEQAFQALPASLAAKVEPYLDAGDQRFRGFTVPDSGETMVDIAGIDATYVRKWWWFRMPVDGPVIELIKSWNPRFRTE
ncbi:MAG: hypothetical protein FWE61_05695 [Micrococcales bacterium]|nr:hypothetical protein [Micrococcales bacterium]